MFVCFVCVLSGRGICDELITRPEEVIARRWAAEPEKQTNKQQNTNHETHFMLSANCYMLRHQGATFIEFNNDKGSQVITRKSKEIVAVPARRRISNSFPKFKP
jgi:hypothetical protein